MAMSVPGIAWNEVYATQPAEPTVPVEVLGVECKAQAVGLGLRVAAKLSAPVLVHASRLVAQ